jgi:hypothetical protein
MERNGGRNDEGFVALLHAMFAISLESTIFSKSKAKGNLPSSAGSMHFSKVGSGRGPLHTFSTQILPPLSGA